MIIGEDGCYSVEEFCNNYSSFPSFPSFIITSKTSNMNYTDLLQMADIKLRQLSNIHPSPKLLERMKERMNIEHTYCVCHIEGSPLSYSEVELVIIHCLSFSSSHSLPFLKQMLGSQTKTIGVQLIELIGEDGMPLNVNNDIILKLLSEQPYPSFYFDELNNHTVSFFIFFIIFIYYYSHLLLLQLLLFY